MNDWQCCLLCEGSSDAALANVLEVLLTRMTREPASVSTRLDLRGSVETKLGNLQQNDAGIYDLIFVHRDADNAGLKARVAEIARAVESTQDTFSIPVIPVVPVTMTETWALASLLDDQECHDWLKRKESISEKTKTVLHRLLSRHNPHNKLLDIGTFGIQRARILSELNTASGSTLSRLTAWNALIDAIQSAVRHARPWLQ